MRHPSLVRLRLVAPLLVSLLAPAPAAENVPAPGSSALAVAIAVQGNIALWQIREESRQSLRALGAPALPAVGAPAAGTP